MEENGSYTSNETSRRKAREEEEARLQRQLEQEEAERREELEYQQQQLQRQIQAQQQQHEGPITHNPRRGSVGMIPLNLFHNITRAVQNRNHHHHHHHHHGRDRHPLGMAPPPPPPPESLEFFLDDSMPPRGHSNQEPLNSWELFLARNLLKRFERGSFLVRTNPGRELTPHEEEQLRRLRPPPSPDNHNLHHHHRRRVSFGAVPQNTRRRKRRMRHSMIPFRQDDHNDEETPSMEIVIRDNHQNNNNNDDNDNDENDTNHNSSSNSNNYNNYHNSNGSISYNGDMTHHNNKHRQFNNSTVMNMMMAMEGDDESSESLVWGNEQPLPVNDDMFNSSGKVGGDNKEEAAAAAAAEELETLYSRLGEDTFSFLFSAPVRSSPFLTGLMVLSVKNAIFALAGVNLMQFGRSNVLGLPPSVEVSVLLSQLLAFIIAVGTQNDLITSLKLIFEGYDKHHMGQAFFGGSLLKWLLTVSSLFIEGALGLTVTFLLIVTSTTVLDVLLNFAAVEFVSQLDEAAFILARLGFLGIRNRLETELIETTTYKVPNRAKHTHLVQTFVLVCILLTALFGWTVICIQQVRGDFAPKALLVQFDDNLRSDLAAYSGTFSLRTRTTRFVWDRFRYTEDNGGLGEFGYCSSERRWTFFHAETDDPCRGIMSESALVRTFDIVDTAQDTWLVQLEESSYTYPTEGFVLEAICLDTGDCGGTARGQCRHGRCRCTPEYFGIRCEFSFESVCPHLELNPLLGSRFVASREIAVSFDPLRDAQTGNLVMIYHHPVYVNDTTYDVIIFGGLRWIITNLQNGFVRFSSRNVTDFAQYLQNNPFHVDKDLQRAELMSEPVAYSTHRETPTPISLSWLRVTNPEDVLNVELVGATNEATGGLLCSVCNNHTNPCNNENHGNVCLADGHCSCQNGEEGVLCQIEPIGNGVCNAFYNGIEFNYDGGDCCEATCHSTELHTCGAIPEAIIEKSNVEIGYPSCSDPSLVSLCVENTPCYVRNSNDVALLFHLSHSYIELSANGRALVMAEPDLANAVRVFEHEGSDWVQLGDTLEGPTSHSLFGTHIALGSMPMNAASAQSGHLPLHVAVGSVLGTISVAHWDRTSTSWSFDEVIDLGLKGILVCDPECPIQRLEIGRIELEPIVLTHLDRTNLTTNMSGNILVFEKPSTRWKFHEYGYGECASLSGNGTTLAVYNEADGTITIYFIVRNATEPSPPALTFSPRPMLQALTGTLSSFTLVSMQLSWTGNKLTIVGNTANGGMLVQFQLFQDREDVVLGSNNNNVMVESTLLEGLPLFGGDVLYRISGDGSVVIFFDVDLKIYAASEGGTWTLQNQLSENAIFGRDVKDEIEFSPAMALSADGSVVAIDRPDPVHVYSRRDPCPNGQVRFHLSIQLDETPDYVSWSLSSVPRRTNNNNNTTTEEQQVLWQECKSCYHTAEGYLLVNVVETVCLPQETVQESCLVLNWTNSVGLLGRSSFAAYVYADNIQELLPFLTGQTAATTTTQAGGGEGILFASSLGVAHDSNVIFSSFGC